MQSRPRTLVLLLLLGSGLSLVLLWATDWPLGVPTEWQWHRYSWSPLEFLAASATALAAGAVYLSVAWLGARQLDASTPRSRSGWLAALSVAGLVWLLWVQSVLLPPVRLGKGAWVLFYPASSGYFTLARDNQSRFGQFLADYEKLMEQRDVLHIGTHPPGLVLLHWTALRLCRNPALRHLVELTEPNSYVDSCQVIEQIEGAANFTPAGQAALWLVILLTHVAAVLTVFPLFWLVEPFSGRTAAWRAACFWPTVPSLLVFLPKSDALYPGLALLFLWSWRKADRDGSVWHRVVAGATFWVGMLFSLAVLPALALAAAISVLGRWSAPSSQGVGGWRKSLTAAGAAGGVFLGLCGLFWTTTRVNLFEVWWWNYHNHAAFYSQFTRTYWKWLLVNPLELTLGLGAPATVLSVLGACRLFAATTNTASLNRAAPSTQGIGRTVRLSWRSVFGTLLGSFCQRPKQETANVDPPGRKPAVELLAVPLVLGLLWLSGKNMGEAARLWLVVMPWPLLLTASAWDDLSASDDERTPHRRSHQVAGSHTWVWLSAVALQLAVCFATAARIDAFNLYRLMQGGTF